MFMKHYAPNKCEPSIEALNFGGRGIRADVNGEVKFLRKLLLLFIFIFFGGWVVLWGEGGGSG